MPVSPYRIPVLALAAAGALAMACASAEPSPPPRFSLHVTDQNGHPFAALPVVLGWLPLVVAPTFTLTTDAAGNLATDSVPLATDSVAIILNRECNAFPQTYRAFPLAANGPTSLTTSVTRLPRAAIASGTFCGEGAAQTSDEFLLAIHFDSLTPQPAGRWAIAYSATRGTEEGTFVLTTTATTAAFQMVPDAGAPPCDPRYTLRAGLLGDTIGPAHLSADGACFASSAPVQLYAHTLVWFP